MSKLRSCVSKGEQTVAYLLAGIKLHLSMQPYVAVKPHTYYKTYIYRTTDYINVIIDRRF